MPTYNTKKKTKRSLKHTKKYLKNKKTNKYIGGAYSETKTFIFNPENYHRKFEINNFSERFSIETINKFIDHINHNISVNKDSYNEFLTQLITLCNSMSRYFDYLNNKLKSSTSSNVKKKIKIILVNTFLIIYIILLIYNKLNKIYNVSSLVFFQYFSDAKIQKSIKSSSILYTIKNNKMYILKCLYNLPKHYNILLNMKSKKNYDFLTTYDNYDAFANEIYYVLHKMLYPSNLSNNNIAIITMENNISKLEKKQAIYDYQKINNYLNILETDFVRIKNSYSSLNNNEKTDFGYRLEKYYIYLKNIKEIILSNEIDYTIILPLKIKNSNIFTRNIILIILYEYYTYLIKYDIKPDNTLFTRIYNIFPANKEEILSYENYKNLTFQEKDKIIINILFIWYDYLIEIKNNTIFIEEIKKFNILKKIENMYQSIKDDNPNIISYDEYSDLSEEEKINYKKIRNDTYVPEAPTRLDIRSPSNASSSGRGLETSV